MKARGKEDFIGHSCVLSRHGPAILDDFGFICVLSQDWFLLVVGFQDQEKTSLGLTRALEQDEGHSFSNDSLGTRSYRHDASAVNDFTF